LLKRRSLPGRAGLLSQEQLANFFQYCASKCGHSPTTAQLLAGQKQSFLAQLAPERPVNLEQFVQLFRWAGAGCLRQGPVLFAGSMHWCPPSSSCTCRGGLQALQLLLEPAAYDGACRLRPA
jgi:hypothetical protein